MPSPAAQPSSRLRVRGSKVCSCHISSWLIALLGMKLHPAIHGNASPQAFAFSLSQRNIGFPFPKCELRFRVTKKKGRGQGPALCRLETSLFLFHLLRRGDRGGMGL